MARILVNEHEKLFLFIWFLGNMKIKEKILRKTTEFLIKEGYHKVTVDEIAAYNGISKRTLYELFLDKMT